MALTTALPEPQPLDASTLPAPQPLSTPASDATTLPAPVALSGNLPAPTPLASTSSSLQAPPLLGPSGPTTIAPSQPSVWERIKDAFSAGIPALNPAFEAAAHTDTGTLVSGETPKMQLVTPEAAMTETEQRRHPILTGAGQVAGGITSPESAALIAGTGGLGELPGAARLVVPRLLSAGFGVQAITSAYQTSKAARDAFARGDTSEGERLLTAAILSGGMGLVAGAHAATGKSIFGTAPEDQETPEVGRMRRRIAQMDAADRAAGRAVPGIEVPFAPTSAVGTVLKEPAPAVRIVDTAAARQDVEAQQTVAPPRVAIPLRVFHGTSAEQVTDISKLDAAYSRTGVAGRGIYVTDQPSQAGAYAGPENLAAGGRVVAGNLKPGVVLLDGNADLPKPLLDAAQKKFGPDIKGTPKNYLDVVDSLMQGLGNVSDFQKQVADAGYDGVRYTAQYPSGPRSGMLLFGKDISGKTAADLFDPTVPTARVVADDYVPVVSQDEVLAQRIQNLIDNSQTMQRIGVDTSAIKTPQDITKMLGDLSAHIQFNVDPRLSTITFDAQRQLAAELGMSVEDLLARRSGTAFNAEQAIASRALLHSSSDRVLSLAAQATDDPAMLKNFTDALSQHQAIMDSVKGVAAESGRALGSFRNKKLPQVKITNALAGLSEGAQAEAAKLLGKLDINDRQEVNDFISKIKPATPADKVFEYYRNALLSSPHVVTVKAASEMAMMALETTKKAVAAGLSKVEGSSQERYSSEAWWYAKGAIQALAHAKDVLTGKFQLEDAPGFEGGGEQAIKGKLGTIVRTPMRILSRQTNLMYTLNYFGELNSQAARAAIGEGLSGNDLYARQEFLAHNPTPTMTAAAHDTAMENTFQNKLAKFGGAISHGISVEPTGIARFLFPFYKTPINLIKESFGYSPYGFLKGALKSDVDLQAKGLIGSSIAAGIAKLALDGYVTGGGPIDVKKRQTLEATGWQPYSIKIGGKYYSYHRAEPLGLSLSLVADTVHGAFTHEDPEVTQSKADNAVAHIARNVSDFPFLMTFSNLSSLTQGDPTTMAQRFIGHLVSGFIPSALGNIAQAEDRTIRRPTSIAEFSEAKIPGMTQRVPALIDVTGQPMQRPVSELGGANPFPVSRAANDPATSELARLAIPTPAPIKHVSAKGHAFPITPDESQAMLEKEGQELHAVLSKFVAHPTWVTLDDPLKVKIIQRVRSDINKNRVVDLARMRAGQ
jgi:hypothetical protein